jgi:hypothetical protein
MQHNGEENATQKMIFTCWHVIAIVQGVGLELVAILRGVGLELVAILRGVGLELVANVLPCSLLTLLLRLGVGFLGGKLLSDCVSLCI